MLLHITNMASTPFLQATPKLPYRNRTIPRNELIIKRVAITNAHQDESKGKSVDENMIVLKMRIKKMKVLESGGGKGREVAAPPCSDWAEWEKKVFTHYREGVLESIEMLQAYLMNTRPSVAIGIMALIGMSCSSAVMMNFVKVAKGLLAGCHVCIDIDF